MKHARLLVPLVLILLAVGAYGQSVTDYALTPSSGTFTPLTGATTPALTGGNTDDGWYNAIPLGFTFTYIGTPYTDVAATTNGCLFPGATLATSYLTNDLDFNSLRPVIAPLWDDMDIASGTFSYKTEGSAGSYIFTAEWLNVLWNYSAAAPVVSFQVKLYEATGKIEFIYRPEAGTINSPSASIGLAGTPTGIGGFLSLTNTSAGPGVSSSTETTTLSPSPAAGQVYAFQILPQTYSSSTVAQIVDSVYQGTVNAPVIMVEVVMSGATSPMNATSFSLNTTGTTSTANISNARLFYTGGTPVFSAATQFGSTVGSPSGSFGFTGTQAMLNGSNYFWLAYTVSAGATVGNLIDGECTSITVGGTPRLPTVTAPAGARVVIAPLVTFNEDFTTYTGSAPPPIGWIEGDNKAILDGGTFGTASSSSWTVDGFGNVGTSGAARFNLYGTSTVDDDWLVSPLISLNTGVPSKLKFDLALTLYSTTDPTVFDANDTVFVVVSTDGGSTFPRANVIGAYHAGTTISNTGQTEEISLAAFSTETNVRIGFYAKDPAGAGDYNVYIDNASIELITAKDIQVLGVLFSPGTPYYTGAPITVSAIIRNGGTEPNPASVPVTYKLGSAPASQGDGVGQVFTPSWTGNMDTVTFTTTYTPGSTGNFTMYVKSFYTGDAIAANDLATKAFRVFPPGALFEDWTAVDALARWKVVDNDGGGNVWVRNTTKYLSAPASVGSTYEGPSLQNDDWLITPKLSILAGDSIIFWHSIQSTSYPETLEVRVSTSGRNIADFTTQIGGFLDGTTDWKRKAYDLGTYAGQNIYVAFVNKGLDEFVLFLDDIEGPAVYVPAVDLATTGFYQSSGLPTPGPELAPMIDMSGKDANTKPVLKLDPSLSRTGIALESHPGTGRNGTSPVIESAPVNLKALVKNVGINAATYSLSWTVGGSAQTPYSGPSVASGVVDTATLTYTPAATGTYLTTGKITVTADEDPDNDSSSFRMRVYPDLYVRQINDRADNVVDTYIGWGSDTIAIKAGMKFNAATTMQMAGLDVIYRTEIVTSGTFVVQVRAAGDSATAPGAVLYTKGYNAADYFTGPGDYVMLPFDGSAPTIAAGADYWITIKYPIGILYSGGAHNTGFASGTSFYESNTDTSVWFPLIITTERSWIMRAIGIPSGVATTVSTGWNMISNPVTTAADSVKQLFPTSTFPYGFAFAGAGGYQQRYRMENGAGYWGKFPGGASVIFSGGTRTLDTIDVAAGWNMVGSISSAVDTSTITSIPAGLRSSTAWFGYNGGYSAAPSIQPGKGYWVKASGPGSFIFPAGPAPERAAVQGAGIFEGMNSVTITDRAGHVQVLYFGMGSDAVEYEMPPVPPQGAFDARFESAEGGAMLKTHAAGAMLPIAIQSADAPLTVSWNVRNGVYLLDAGQGLKQMGGQGSLTITAPVSRLTLRSAGSGELPADYALLQNYPNPFNPSTTIGFALPVESRVSVEIFNALGQRVKTLVDGTIVAGFHGVEWNGDGGAGQQLGSGVYFVRFSATGTDGRTFGDVRKLMLMK